MSDNLHFNPGWYKITKLLEPNVLEIEETWFVKLKGVGDNNPREELTKWLRENDIVRVIPYSRSKDARIISDIWLGNTHINRQFSNYKTDNLIQTFQRWYSVRDNYNERTIKTEREFIDAFNTARRLLPGALQRAFESWKDSCGSQKQTGPVPLGIEEIVARRQEAQAQMIETFNLWRKDNKHE